MAVRISPVHSVRAMPTRYHNELRRWLYPRVGATTLHTLGIRSTSNVVQAFNEYHVVNTDSSSHLLSSKSNWDTHQFRFLSNQKEMYVYFLVQYFSIGRKSSFKSKIRELNSNENSENLKISQRSSQIKN